MKIRYYGILSNRNRSTKLAKVMEFLLVRGSVEDGRIMGFFTFSLL